VKSSTPFVLKVENTLVLAQEYSPPFAFAKGEMQKVENTLVLAIILIVTLSKGLVAASPAWRILNSLEGVGLGETLHAPTQAAGGWDALAVSASQEFAAVCDTAGV